MPAFRHRAAHFALARLGMFNRSYKEVAFGREFVIPIINGQKTYISELWMADVISRLLEIAPGAFIDVGVNLGQTLLKVAAADPSRHYIGFEPNPACSHYSAELIRANSLPFVVVPAGLGSKTGVEQLQFYREEPTDPSASLVKGFRQGELQSRAVVILSLQDLPPGMIPDEIAVVKIDVEGGEADVIAGMAPILDNQRPFVLIEILPAYSEDFTDRIQRQQQIEIALSDADYRMYRIHKDSSDRLDYLESIEKIGIHGDLALSDYLMVPSERVAALAGFKLGANQT